MGKNELTKQPSQWLQNKNRNSKIKPKQAKRSNKCHNRNERNWKLKKKEEK